MAFPFCVAAVLPSGRVQAAIQIHPAGQAPRHALGISPGAFLMGKGEIPEADTYFILLESGGTIHPPFSFIENMQIITKTLKEIHPYEHNPRKNDQAVDAVAESISAFGFKVPIIIDKNGTIVAGHTRYKAARKLKLKEVPCIIKEDKE